MGDENESGINQTYRELGENLDWSTEPNPSFVDGFHVMDMKDMFSVVFSCGMPFAMKDGDSLIPSKVVASLRMNPRGMQEFVAAVVKEWNDHVGRIENADNRVQLATYTSSKPEGAL